MLVKIVLCLIIYFTGCICVYGFNKAQTEKDFSYLDMVVTCCGVIGCAIMFVVLCFTGVL